MSTNEHRWLASAWITGLCLLCLVACKSSIKSTQKGIHRKASTQINNEDRGALLTALVRHIAESTYHQSTPAPRFLILDPEPGLAFISTELKGLQVLQITNRQDRPKAAEHQEIVRDVIVSLRGPLQSYDVLSGSVVVSDRGSVLYDFTAARAAGVWTIERWQPTLFVD